VNNTKPLICTPLPNGEPRIAGPAVGQGITDRHQHACIAERCELCFIGSAPEEKRKLCLFGRPNRRAGEVHRSLF
jgi:hypothetical protein